MISFTRQNYVLLLLGLCLPPIATHAATPSSNRDNPPQVYVDLTQNNTNDQGVTRADNTGTGSAATPALPPSGLTADDAKNNSTDLSLMQQIRRAIVADNTLSTAAQNINIVAHDGKVTLQGTVNSDAERRTILAAATKVAGTTNIEDALTVANATVPDNR